MRIYFGILASALLCTTCMCQEVEVRAPGPGGRPPARQMLPRRPFVPREGTSVPLAALRQAMAEELKNVPLLDEKIREIVSLQQERMTLIRERQKFANDPGRPSQAEIREFHELLEREDKLTTRQRDLIAGFARDAESLRQEAQKRLDEINGELQELKNKRDAGEPPAVARERELGRFSRFYSLFLERLDDLKERPDDPDWMRRFGRAFWAGDLDPQSADQLRRRLTEIEQDREELRRRCDQIDARIGELREMIESISRHDAAPHAPGTQQRSRARQPE